MDPEHIGRYEIKSEIGRGGMATVYRAYDPRFKREVAIKILPSQFLHDPTFRARFEREAQMIAAIEHPSIVPVYDYGEENGQPFLVMRYMHGGSLSDLLKKGPLSLRETARIINQLAPALDEMHSRGVIHRDLKPGNILFDHYGNAFISDFGIARLTAATTTLTGDAIIGTPAYMSPEQARGETDIDGRSDIYALGAILFEMLTGKQPYQATTPMGIAMKHITEPVPRILDYRTDLPPTTEAVITRAMAKRRDDRYPTARDLAVAQEAIARDVSLQQAAPTAPDRTPLIPRVEKLPREKAEAVSSEPPSGGNRLPPAIAPRPAQAGSGPLEKAPAAQPAPVVSRPPSSPAMRPAPQPKAQRSRNWIWLLGGVVVIAGLCLTVSAIGLPSLLAAIRPKPTPTTPVDTPLTAEPSPAIETGSTPAAPPQVDVFIDDFSRPDSGWDRGEDDGSITDYEGGLYRIYVDKPNMFYWANPGLDFSDVTIEVEATKSSGPDDNFFGLICRYQDPYNFYMLAISSDGYYSIRKYQDGEFTFLGADQWQFSSAIHQGKTTNQIRADCIGDTLTLFSNGTKLAEATDQSFHSGDVGLTAASLKMAGTNILFDNFVAKKP